jgi:dimethylaniline monooxygenase (N-oxide forming)
VAKRVAVIGAGPSGVVAVKELLDEGHHPTCFERSDGLGGVFRFGEIDGVVWESCRLTSSGLLTAFSDFPDPSGRTGHLTVGEYVEYLTAYADSFGVTPHIRFGTNVESIAPHPTAGWNVRTHDAGRIREEHYEAVAICSGLHQHPHVPRFLGLETFTGSVLHGAHYRRPAQVAGKKVLVVGAGESGADVVAEVARNAAETVLSLRRGVAVQPRRMFGVPKDYLTSRILNSASHWVFQTRNPSDARKRRIYKTAFIPLVVLDKALQLFYRFFWEYLPLYFARNLGEIRTNLKTRGLTVQLLEESGGTVTEQFGTKTDDFVRAMAMGRCRRVPAIARFDGPQVTFDDGSHFEPDLVLLCTGFDTRMPFLAPDIAAAPRYLHAFNPQIGPTLGFIGFLRPAFGAIPPLAELQARWFALLMSNKLQLPAAGEMRESIESWTQFRSHVFRAVRERLDHLVDHTPFCDELASQIGCKPTSRAIRQETLAFRLRFFAAPFVAAQYRLIGPHAKPELARTVITGLPITHPLPDLINLYMRWTMSRVLHRILGPEYAPKLALNQ